ncbi:hypothetical protein [Paenibacillus pinihumi]|uniref:hypothetical protein n=1 Tax=Paenibacillus pinihumi TaxID=669462 RepID=UPI00048FA11A|nr:hypothetical protein [Paenibacillus pinihumi]
MSLNSWVGQKVELVVSGKPQPCIGTLIDVGDDILVFTIDNRFYYVPVKHLHHVKSVLYDESVIASPTENPMDPVNGERNSYRKILMNARGLFVELYVTGTYSLSGYTTSIMNDYLVFYSSVFHTVYVSLDHLKCIMPYPLDTVPYSVEKEQITVKPSAMTLARSFEQQLKKMEGRMVVLDLGDAPDKIGLVQSVDQGMLTLLTAEGRPITWNVCHIKSAHNP